MKPKIPELYALFTETNESGVTFNTDPSMKHFVYKHTGMNLAKTDEYILIGNKNSIPMNLYEVVQVSGGVLFKKPYTKIAKVIDLWAFDHNTETLISLFSKEYAKIHDQDVSKMFDIDTCNTVCEYIAMGELKPITERDVIDMCIDALTKEPSMVKLANAISWAWLMADKSALNITVESVYDYAIKTYPGLEKKILKNADKKLGKRWKTICKDYFTALTGHYLSDAHHIEDIYNHKGKLDEKMEIYAARVIADILANEAYMSRHVMRHPIRPKSAD